MGESLNIEKRAEFLIKLKQRYRDLWTDIRAEVARADAESYQDTAGETHDLGDEATADLVVDINLADVHRDIGQSLTFGHGAHFCLGAALARIEGRIALEEVLKRWPEWDVDTPQAVRAPTSTVRGWDSMPVIVG